MVCAPINERVSRPSGSRLVVIGFSVDEGSCAFLGRRSHYRASATMNPPLLAEKRTARGLIGENILSVRSIAMAGTIQDLRYAIRGLANAPGFTTVAVLTLALGIGANTAIFSVVDQLMLRPLPYPAGDQLVVPFETFQGAAAGASNFTSLVSPANWLDWQRDNRTLQSLAAWSSVTGGVTMTGSGEPARLNAQAVSWEFFPLLAVQPLLGRTITQADDLPNAPRVAVLSYQLWQHRFHGDTAAIGRVIQLNNNPVEIVGVMPDGFRFVHPDNELWTAYQLDRHLPWRNQGRFIRVVGRLKSGMTLASAQTDLGDIGRRLAATYEYNKKTGVDVASLRDVVTGEVHS